MEPSCLPHATAHAPDSGASNTADTSAAKPSSGDDSLVVMDFIVTRFIGNGAAHERSRRRNAKYRFPKTRKGMARKGAKMPVVGYRNRGVVDFFGLVRGEGQT